jgi:hypothetical protein
VGTLLESPTFSAILTILDFFAIYRHETALGDYWIRRLSDFREASSNHLNEETTMVTRILLAGLVSVFAASAASAQDYQAINNAWNARLNASMAANTNSIVNRNLNDPRVQAAYRQHQAHGGRSTPQQFAYWYAATAGGTPQGIANFQAAETQNRINERNALNGLRQAEEARGRAQAGYAAGFQKNNAEFGNLLMGNSTYTNPNTHSNYVLPHTVPAGHPYRDSVGNYFQTDTRGNQYIYNNGRWYPLNAGR